MVTVVVSAVPGDTVGLVPEVIERLIKALWCKASGKRFDDRGRQDKDERKWAVVAVEWPFPSMPTVCVFGPILKTV